MSSLFVWQVYEEDEWGTIAASTGGTLTPLVTRREDVAREHMRSYAAMHRFGSGLPVRLARYDFAESLETLA